MFADKCRGGRFAAPAARYLLALMAVAPVASALELDEAELFLELNDTDGDLGIHASIDGGPYTLLEIEDPHERRILKIRAAGRLARQGLTQLFLESAEPTFDELPPASFFQRFPEGPYEISAQHAHGEFETLVDLSHVLAAPPGNVTVSGIPAAESCDADFLPLVSWQDIPVLIDWDPVTASHPEIGRSGPVEIARYQFFVEQDDLNLAVDLPPTATKFLVPATITARGGTFKFEIIARTTERNNTAIESCFVVAHAEEVEE